MITLNIRRLCKLRAIQGPYAFLRANGFSHYQAHALGAGAIREIKLAHIEKLCRIFRCLPHELFDYKPSGPGLNPDDDVLAPLRKEPLHTHGLQGIMASLSAEEVIRITTEIQERYAKPRRDGE